MSSPQGTPSGNRLLESLPATDRRRMLAGFEAVELALAEVLYSPGERLSHVYFPTQGFISLIMPVDASSSLEVGLVGSEGMFGIPLVLGVDVSPVRAVVQGSGSRVAHGRRAFPARAEARAGAGTRARPLCLCPAQPNWRRPPAARASTWSKHASPGGS